MDDYEALSTSLLVRMTHRVTPRGELGKWALTSRWGAGDRDDSVLRAMAIEQLQHYNVDAREINRLRS